VRKIVGQAVRDYMLQSGNYEQDLVVIGVAAINNIANSEAITRGSLSIDNADIEVVCNNKLRRGSYK